MAAHRRSSTGPRQSLMLLSLSAPSLMFGLPPARAEHIPLFGLRKKLRTIEEGAEEIVKEGEKAVEQGIEAAEKEIQVVEKEIGVAVAVAATGLELGLVGDLVQRGPTCRCRGNEARREATTTTTTYELNEETKGRKSWGP